jgi:N-acetylmuramic acid 6-phosphate etherase
MRAFVKVTEQPSHYRHLEKMTVSELLMNINREDQSVPLAVEKALPQIEKLVEVVSERLMMGGRLFYMGSGTSGRLGILDASEIPPTFGLSQGIVIGIISGGEEAIRKPIEKAEDSWEDGWLALEEQQVTDADVVIGVAASGTTPFVIGALAECQKRGIATGCITCNEGSPLEEVADYPVVVVVGPEFVTGSTRMKSGTAQKLVLNMISTAAMIQIGRVEDNRMVNMQLTNNKLVDRGVKMLLEKTGLTDYQKAQELLLAAGSVKKALDKFRGDSSTSTD